MLTFLTQRFKRRALTKPNLTYFFWRFVANGMRTLRAMTTAHSYSDTRYTGTTGTTARPVQRAVRNAPPNRTRASPAHSDGRG